MVIADDSQDIALHLESVKKIISVFEENSNSGKQQVISEQSLASFCEEMKLLKIDRDKAVYFMMQHAATDIQYSSKEIKHQSIRTELLRLKLKYGDPVTVEAYNYRDIGRRHPNWRRTKVNEMSCLVDNPFSEQPQNSVNNLAIEVLEDSQKDLHIEPDVLTENSEVGPIKSKRITAKRLFRGSLFIFFNLLEPYFMILLLT